jgi:hypothetical protein
MSSPFSIFRKHQKLMLAFFGVILMVVFTIGGVLSQSGPAPGSDDELAVTWDGGELTRNRLSIAHDMRKVVAQFLQRAQQISIGRGAYPDEYKRALQQYFQTGQFPPLPVEPIMSEESVDREGYQGTVRSFVLAQEASNMGFVVTDEQITDYLLRLVDRKISGPDLRSMMEGSSGRFTEKSFYEVLRREMLAERLFQEVSRTGAAMPPAQEFDYYVRLFRQVSVEALAIPMEQFVGQVSDPTDSELAAYFDKYKTALPPTEFVGRVVLDSPDPGFKLPHRVSIEYLKGVADTFKDEVRGEVTDDEILAYYEEEKLRDQQLQQDDLPLPKLDNFGDKEPGTEPGKTPATPEGDASDSKDAPDNKDAPETKEPAETKGAPDTTDPPAADPAGPPKPDEKDCEDSDDSEDADSADPPVEKEEKAEEKPPATADAPPAAATDDATDSSDPAPADTKPDDTKPDDTKPAETKPDETETSPAKPNADEVKPGDAEKSDGTDSRKKEIKFKPLAEVRDYIRGRLTEQKAAARLQQKLAEIRARMDNYHTARIQADVGQEPTPPNIKSFVEKDNFEYAKHDMLSFAQYDETTDIGKSYEEVPQTDGRPPRQIQFETTAFQKGPQSLYRPYQTQDDDGYYYVYWKTAEADEEVPKLDDKNRKQVVHAWKLGAGVEDESGKSRGLALKRAEELADQLRSGATFDQLAKVQPGSEVVKTGMFSWLTFDRLNQVAGIEQAGADFMRAVFQLKPNEVTVAMNHPKTIVYVVRVTAENKSPQTLQQNYLDEMESPFVQYQINVAQSMDQMLAQQRWLEDVERKLNVKWEKPELRDVR